MLIEDPTVLLVEDSDNDAVLVRIVFERSGFVQPIHILNYGEEVIAYLKGDGEFADRKKFPLPAAVLLDLNLPKKNGFEVLEWIRRQPEHRRLCVYILSASSREEDIQRAYDLGANSYLVKPSTLDELTVVAKGLLAWLRLSHFYVSDETSSVDAA